MLFLAVSLAVAGLVLMRRGKTPRTALVAGNSMEPTLLGPSLKWRCSECGWNHRFGRDSVLLDSPFRCPTCGSLSSEPIVLTDHPILISPSSETTGMSDRISYWPRRLMAAKRSSRSESTDFEGLQRGDLVVIQSPDQTLREIKRVVGFPNERIEIRQGNLWVDNRPWKKSITQLLQQSVLVHANDPVSSFPKAPEGEVSADGSSSLLQHRWTDGSHWISGRIALGNQTAELFFQTADGGWIDNRYIGNLHDSHALVAVEDIGVAIKLDRWSEEWGMRVTLRSPGVEWMSTVDVSGNDWSISSLGEESSANIAAPDFQNKSAWLLWACVDGDGILCLNQRELLRVSLDEVRSSGIEPSPQNEDGLGQVSPVELRCQFGELELGQILVFRDTHYRGAGDAPVQRFEHSEGLVLLGDNVSLSNDSRQRWETGLELTDIAGVMEWDRSGLENLLRQRELLPEFEPTRADTIGIE